jgi:hypothetical protein
MNEETLEHYKQRVKCVFSLMLLNMAKHNWIIVKEDIEKFLKDLELE